MKNQFLSSRRWLAMTAVATALTVTGFLGVHGASLPNPTATVKTATRSEAAAKRGYSAVVKRVVPAVVNISSSRVVKSDRNAMRGMEDNDMFRQFFGDDM